MSQKERHKPLQRSRLPSFIHRSNWRAR